MCWACDNPDRSLADYVDHLRGLVQRYGWAVQIVEREGNHPPFAYTVGLTAHDTPELLVSGMEPESASDLLNRIACELVHHSSVFQPGEQLELEDGPVLEVVRVSQPTVHLVLAVELYGPDVGALQLVHADSQENWPWEPNYCGDQRVLGPRGPSTR